MSMPRSKSRFLACRNASGYRMYMIAIRRFTSGKLLKQRIRFLVTDGCEPDVAAASRFALTLPPLEIRFVSIRLRDQVSRQPVREGHDGQSQVLVRQNGNNAAVADVEVVVVVGAQIAVHHAFLLFG